MGNVAMNYSLTSLLAITLFAAAPTAAQSRRPKAAALPTAAQVIARMLAKYDHAGSFEGTLSVHILQGGAERERLIRTRAISDSQGFLLRSNTTIIDSPGGGRPSSQVTRIDDGRVLWSFTPPGREFSRETRKRDRLSNLLRPFIDGAKRFAPTLKVRLASNDLMEVRKRFILSGQEKGKGEVAIHVDAKSYSLLGLQARADGREMRMETIDQRWGGRIPDALFRFEPPAGARQLPTARPGGIFGAGSL